MVPYNTSGGDNSSGDGSSLTISETSSSLDHHLLSLLQQTQNNNTKMTFSLALAAVQLIHHKRNKQSDLMNSLFQYIVATSETGIKKQYHFPYYLLHLVVTYIALILFLHQSPNTYGWRLPQPPTIIITTITITKIRASLTLASTKRLHYCVALVNYDNL